MTGNGAGVYGTAEAPTAWRTLSAGPLSVDLEAGQLRYVRFHGTEVLRAISFLARDRYWGTFAANIEDLSIDEGPGRFTVRYKARCAPDAGDLRYEVEIVGEADGRLSFHTRGAPLGDFLTNRTGFVVLHPLEGVAGEEVELEHASGGRETVRLPELISPHEPAQDIFAITHSARGLSVRVEMTGDAYDMEDQRNWTDASFKTYIRPLSKPKPYTMPAGAPFEQSVTVVMSGEGKPAASTGKADVVRVGRPLGQLPRIGLAVEGKDAPASERQASDLQGIAEIVGRPSVPEEVAALAAVARAAGARLALQFAIPGHEPTAELEPWARASAGAGVAAVLVVPHRLYPLRPEGRTPGPAALEAIAEAAREAFPGLQIGGGTMTGFTEFNRNRPPTGLVDFVTHATSAIVHAADDRSVLESLEALPNVCRSAIALAGGLPYRLGPVAIGLALNPDGPPRYADAENRRATMIRNDPRQRGLFGAAWLLGYVAAVAPFGIDTLVAGQVVGDFGIIDDEGLRPVYHVVRALARNAARPAAAVEGLPAGCVGLILGDDTWVANLSSESHRVRLSQPRAIKVLDEAMLAEARRDSAFLDHPRAENTSEFELGPFALARVFA